MISVKKKIALISQVLDSLYPAPAIPLDHKDTYTLLIAVLLSAQCTDKRVNLVTPHLFALANTPQKMSKQKQETVEAIVRPCGLAPSKSKHIVELSKMLVTEFGGKVPHTFEELERLPGVGHKTASVVMVHAFKVPAFPVDTHIHRLAARWGLSDGTTVVKTEKDLKTLFPKEEWEKRHLQMIYFGREYCKAVKHDKKACPICGKL
jgi:endonuclease III